MKNHIKNHKFYNDINIYIYIYIYMYIYTSEDLSILLTEAQERAGPKSEQN